MVNQAIYQSLHLRLNDNITYNFFAVIFNGLYYNLIIKIILRKKTNLDTATTTLYQGLFSVSQHLIYL